MHLGRPRTACMPCAALCWQHPRRHRWRGGQAGSAVGSFLQALQRVAAVPNPGCGARAQEMALAAPVQQPPTPPVNGAEPPPSAPPPAAPLAVEAADPAAADAPPRPATPPLQARRPICGVGCIRARRAQPTMPRNGYAEAWQACSGGCWTCPRHGAGGAVSRRERWCPKELL